MIHLSFKEIPYSNLPLGPYFLCLLTHNNKVLVVYLHNKGQSIA